MPETHIVGIDPGLRDTGVVMLTFHPDAKTVSVRTFVIDGQVLSTNPNLLGDWLDQYCKVLAHVFIEKFVPRPGMNTTPQMVELERKLASALRSPNTKLIRNTGVKQIIVTELLKLLGVWQFDIVTNHDDLRSAARIGLYGMAKDTHLNTLLADVVRDSLAGEPWVVTVWPGERYAP